MLGTVCTVPLGPLLGNIQTEFEVHVFGLGFSLVEVTVKGLNLKTRQLVLATPISDGEIHLRIVLCLKLVNRMVRRPAWLRLVPSPLLNAILPPILLQGFAHDVKQDFAIWEHKRFVQPPALAEGDGPVGKYRQWARQFYS